MLYLFRFTLIAVFLVGANLSAPVSATTPSATCLKLDEIVVKSLEKTDQAEFVDFFVKTFEEAYKNFTLEQLGKKGYSSKEEWLRDTAKEEAENALSPQEGSHYLLFYAGKEIVGYVSIHLEDDGKVLYLGQMCIHKNFQRKGFARHIMESVVPKYAPNAKRYTLLVRVLNKDAMIAYEKIGFVADDKGKLVEQHKYDPKHYLGMVKDIK